MPLLVGDADRRAVAAAVAVTGGVGAVLVRGDVVGPGVVDRHGQLVVFRSASVAATGIGDVGNVDLVGPIRRRGEGAAVGNRHEGATVERVLHGDVAGRQVVVQ